MLNIIPIPAFQDNYIWTLHDGQHAVVVDPGDAAQVRTCLDTHKLKLAAILCTHHHGDHVGGVCELAQLYNVPVYGPRNENVPGTSQPVGEGNVVTIAELDIKLEVLDIPGHTRGHVAYLGMGAIFCGDTLFGCACGKLCEGTAEQLHHSLQRLANLPGDTRVYCGHEYTEDNILFALACEPGNAQLKQRQADARALRAAGQPTMPSTIALEKATNPFLRCTETEIIRNVVQQSGLEFSPSGEAAVFTALREWKNAF